MADTIDTLNDLRAVCLDSEEGFGKAAKGVHDENLQHRFMGLARQRADFAEELAAYVRQLGGNPASAHRSGVQHRGWRDLETAIRPKDDATFIRECEQGEDNTLRHYERALAAGLPEPARPAVERQRLAIAEAMLELGDLEQLRSA
jgi:uncharacterized protein (TIGR02284 family)